MTLKEFSKAYNVPYHIVYEASYKVPTESNLMRDRDFSERGLFDAVMEIADKRIEKHTRVLERQRKIKDNLMKGK